MNQEQLDAIIFAKPPDEVLDMLANELNTIAGHFDVKLRMMEHQISADKPEKALQQIDGLKNILQALVRTTEQTRRYVEQRKTAE